MASSVEVGITLLELDIRLEKNFAFNLVIDIPISSNIPS